MQCTPFGRLALTCVFMPGMRTCRCRLQEEAKDEVATHRGKRRLLKSTWPMAVHPVAPTHHVFLHSSFEQGLHSGHVSLPVGLDGQKRRIAVDLDVLAGGGEE